MAEPTRITFSYKEIVEWMIKQQDIHEGIWGLYVRFGIKATNIGGSPADVLPAAVIPVLEMGIQKFDDLNNLSVDAAKVNPLPSGKKRPRR